ncbi:MAG: transcription repressor NadR [Fusicatenibacter sp.]|nr:transcription repressor NadR [Fusicatenibacter sp.]
MSGKERREEIIRIITDSAEPVSGTVLSAQCGVSRQVIVQDIALIRAAGYDVIATNRGYLCKTPQRVVRIFKVYHTDEQMQDELNTIVDFGGTVLDVFVHHEVYGELRADLSLSSRMRVAQFMEGIHKGTSKPLKDITSGLHFHTVSADSERTLDLIERELEQKGYLV